MDQYKIEIEYKRNRTEARFFINDKMVFGFRYYPTPDIGYVKEFPYISTDIWEIKQNNNLITIIPIGFMAFQKLLIVSVLVGTIKDLKTKHKAITMAYHLDRSILNCWYDFLLKSYEIPESTERERQLTLTAHALRVYLGLSR